MTRLEPGLKLERSPLILVLSQIRFSAVLKMADFIPDIQEAMRGEGLARFTQEESQQVVFGPVVKTNQTTRWVFSNRAQTEAVILSNDFFVYEVSKYDVFETFTSRLLPLFEHVCKAAKLSFAVQTGLRYIDLLQGNANHNVDDFISETLRGLTAEQLGVKTANHQFVIQAETDLGTLFLRSYENTGDQFLPPDLQTKHLQFKASTSSDEEFRILDFDNVSLGDFDLDGDAVEQKLWQLHASTDRAFRAAVTEVALEYWKGDVE